MNVSIQSDISPAKILVVDDNNLYAKVISFRLRGAGYQVATARDGAEAVSFARGEKPDLILLDTTFPPDVSGALSDAFGIMEWLHHLDGAGNIPFIIITDADDMRNQERAIANGAAAFFHKPLNYDDLFKAIDAILRVSTPKLETRAEV